MIPIELNENGLAVWRHKYVKTLFAERHYRWCNRMIVLDETENRSIIDDVQFSIFDFANWIPVTIEEYKKVKQSNKDIFGEVMNIEQFMKKYLPKSDRPFSRDAVELLLKLAWEEAEKSQKYRMIDNKWSPPSEVIGPYDIPD